MATAATQQTTDTLVPNGPADGVTNTTTPQPTVVDHPEGDAIRRQVSPCMSQ
jgi:hypothetical protein